MSKILPCPNCNSHAFLIQRGDFLNIECAKCGVSGPIPPGQVSEEKAIKNFNTRNKEYVPTKSFKVASKYVTLVEGKTCFFCSSPFLMPGNKYEFICVDCSATGPRKTEYLQPIGTKTDERYIFDN